MTEANHFPTGILAIAIAAACAGCISSAKGASLPQLQRRAAIDLGCAPHGLQHFALDTRTTIVRGCGRQLVYVESCESARGRHHCTWLADSPTLPPAPAPPVLAAAPCLPSNSLPPNSVPSNAAGEPRIDAATAVPPTTPEPAEAAAELPIRAHARGQLHVASANGFCTVSVDGQNYGATPVAGISLPEGVARIACQTPDKTIQRQVRIEPGQIARVRIDLAHYPDR